MRLELPTPQIVFQDECYRIVRRGKKNLNDSDVFVLEFTTGKDAMRNEIWAKAADKGETGPMVNRLAKLAIENYELKLAADRVKLNELAELDGDGS